MFRNIVYLDLRILQAVVKDFKTSRVTKTQLKSDRHFWVTAHIINHKHLVTVELKGLVKYVLQQYVYWNRLKWATATAEPLNQEKTGIARLDGENSGKLNNFLGKILPPRTMRKDTQHR